MPAASDSAHTTSRPKYHALITYVPEEFIWCDWLHRQLDGTTVPADLADKRTRHGFTRPATVHVFPDPRNPTHLARHATSPPPCRHLIVICSPHSASSPALDEQIRAFKRTEGEDRIVVLVVDGDPEHDSAPVGHDDTEWLPAWLRWRVDKSGNFRPAEASEPQIIDARADRLSPPEARAQLLAALLDVPRDSLRAYDDLVLAEASDTLAPTAREVEEPIAPPKRGAAGLIVASLVVVIAGGAYWWTTRSTGDPAVKSIASSVSPAIPAATPQPMATPAPTPAPKLASAPKPSQPTPAPKPIVALPVAKVASVSTPAAPTAPMTKVTTAFAASEGPQTPVTSITASRAQLLPLDPASSWQRMRDLGDTLLSRGNRGTALIALTQSVDVGLRVAAAPGTSVSERFDIARLCFRVGALQKQFTNHTEARRSVQRGRSLLESMQLTGEDASERDALVANMDQLLRSIPR